MPDLMWIFSTGAGCGCRVLLTLSLPDLLAFQRSSRRDRVGHRRGVRVVTPLSSEPASLRLLWRCRAPGAQPQLVTLKPTDGWSRRREVTDAAGLTIAAVAVFSRTGVRTQDVVRKGFDGFEDVNQFWAGGSLRRCLHVLYSLPLKPDLLHVHCAVLSHSSY